MKYKVKEENIARLSEAMTNMMMAMKQSSAACTAICGDVSEKELIVIEFIHHQQSVKMREISDHMDIPLSTLTSIVDKLVSKKYLSRYHSDEDRRVVKVTLAEKAKDTYQTLNEERSKIAGKMLAAFDEEEQDTLMNLLERIPSSLS